MHLRDTTWLVLTLMAATLAGSTRIRHPGVVLKEHYEDDGDSFSTPLPECFVVIDSAGQKLAYVYFELYRPSKSRSILIRPVAIFIDP
jgi:hypothetical protein